MSRSVDTLFRPFTANGLTMPNRVVMAPMTRNFSPDGVPGANVAAYYRRRAENHCGLIITEGTTVNSPVAGGYPDVPHFWGPALTGWKHVVDEVHDAGGLIIPQLWHVGMQRESSRCENSELPGQGPSGINRKFEVVAEPMTVTQIEETIAAFARAAVSARELGFDGVEIHGAHGYLLDQFFWERTNLRTDAYGGSLENRVRFGAEVVARVRQEVGADFPIFLRISQWKGHDYDAKLCATPQELDRLLQPLVAAGVDVFDCSQRRFWEPEFKGSTLNLAGWVKKLSGKPTISVGSVGLSGDFIGGMNKGESSDVTGIDALLDRLEKDEFDLIAIGRAILVDPAWTSKIRDGRFEELQPFRKESLGVLT